VVLIIFICIKRTLYGPASTNPPDYFFYFFYPPEYPL